MFIGKVNITLKESVLDPQGQAVKKALHDLGEEQVQDVRIGKYIELKIQANSQREAEEKLEKYCKQLLVNPVIETYKFQVEKL